MEACDFLKDFIGKEIQVKDGNKKATVKILQCPKCSDGTFTNPIMFVAHLIQDCPDFTKYMDDPKIYGFLKEEDLGNLLKDVMKQVQGIATPVGATK